MHAVIIRVPPVGPLDMNAIVLEIVIPLGILNELDGLVVVIAVQLKLVPLMEHAEMALLAALATYADLRTSRSGGYCDSQISIES